MALLSGFEVIAGSVGCITVDGSAGVSGIGCDISGALDGRTGVDSLCLSISETFDPEEVPTFDGSDSAGSKEDCGFETDTADETSEGYCNGSEGVAEPADGDAVCFFFTVTETILFFVVPCTCTVIVVFPSFIPFMLCFAVTVAIFLFADR